MRPEHAGISRSATHAGVIAVLGLSILAALWIVGFHLESKGGRACPPATAGASPPAAGDRLRVLDPGRHVETFAGRVVDPSGKPLAGARVTLGRHECLTDRGGYFQLPRTSDTVQVSLEGYFPLRSRQTRTLVLLPGATVSGRVTDDDGQPVCGARIALARDLNSETEEISSDSEGRWRSPLQRPGPVHVLVRHAAYRSADRLILLREPGEDNVCDIVLRRGELFELSVVDRHGQPLPGAQVWLESRPSAGEGTESRYLGRTDDFGKIRGRREQRRAAKLKARLPGYREASQEIHGSQVVLALAPAPQLQAQAIVAETGLPVRPSAVRLQYLSGREFLRVPHKGMLFHSLAAGKIRVGLPPVPGAYRITVAARNHLYGVSDRVMFDGRTSPPPFLVRLENRLRLAGTVRHHGKPLPGAHVEVLGFPAEDAPETFLFGVPVGALPEPVLATSTDRGGRFEFATLSRGFYRIAVAGKGLADYLSPPLSLPGSLSSEDHAVSLHEKGRIYGIVVPEGRDRPRTGGAAGAGFRGHADVPLILLSSRLLPRTTWTDAEGRYEFPGLPPASDYRLVRGDPVAPFEEVRRDAGQAAIPLLEKNAAPGIVLTPGGEARYDLEAPAPSCGSVEGRVLLDGKPQRLGLTLLPLHTDASPRRLSTDAAGGFLVRGVVPGRYRLKGITYPIEREVNITAGCRSLVSVALQALEYSVTVRSAAGGKPLQVPWSLELRRVGDEAFERQTSEGNSSIVRTLLPGRYHVRLSAGGYATREEFVDLTENRADSFALQPGIQVRLQLRKENGDFYRGEAEVEVFSGVERLYSGVHHIEEYLDLPALPRGEYTLVVRGEGRTSRSRLSIGPPEGEESGVERPRGTAP